MAVLPVVLEAVVPVDWLLLEPVEPFAEFDAGVVGLCSAAPAAGEVDPGCKRSAETVVVHRHATENARQTRVN